MEKLDCLKIKNIIKNKNRIDYVYEADGKWKELINLNERMFSEYDFNIEEVPNSIAIIPFLSNILPISWVFNLAIEIEELDKTFFEGIPEIKNGYINMHKELPMLGNLKVNKLEENLYEPENTGTLFSGGVDAFNTLFQHMEEKPILLTLWGADLKLDDIEGWSRVTEHHIDVAKKYGLKYSFIKTNFRTTLNYKALSGYVSSKVNGEWWHDFQHGIAILGNIAPIAYVKKMKTVYIASSNTIESRKKVVCASDPTIDNYVSYASCKVIHDGFEYTRQDKIHNICEYLEKSNKEDVQLRVCWKSSGGENCCECEKCYRTILEILVEKKEPNNFGFDFTEEKRKKMMRNMPKIKLVKYNFANYYSDAQKALCKNYTKEDTPKDLLWFRDFKLRNEKPKYLILLEKTNKKIKGTLKSVIKKLNK